jgi:hypothetical protein
LVATNEFGFELVVGLCPRPGKATGRKAVAVAANTKFASPP